MNRLRIFAIFLAAALSLSGAASAQRGPASVFVAPVETKTFTNRIEALGTLEANERVELTVNVADRVTGVYFEDGERVKKGDTLLSLVQGEQAAQVEGAAATVAEARKVVDRMRPLVGDGVVSQVQFDEAQRNLQVARSELTKLRIQQRERVLSAPFDGVLGFRRVSVGSYLSPGNIVTTLVDDSVMKLDFDVPSLHIAKLRRGVEIEATTADYPGRIFEGEIQSIDNTIDPVTRSVTVRALIPNDDRLLRPGAFMSVIVKAAPSDSLAIPEEAIQPVGPQFFVFVAEDSAEGLIARRTEVELGRRQDGMIEVISGLVEGQQVITEGVIRVREGAPVIVRDSGMLTPDGVSKNGGSASAGSTGAVRAR